jgi:glutamate/tyrosine decarboxylase-like PLP-dependent enzyme
MDPREEWIAQSAALLAEAHRLGMDFRDGLGRRRVIAAQPYVPAGALPEEGRGTAAALEELSAAVLPALSGSAGPRYLGFVTGGSTPASLAADWLVSATDQNLSDRSQATATALEHHALALSRELFGLPSTFDGAFVTGGTQANLVGLAVGRQWVSERLGFDAAQDGLAGHPPIRILAAAPHASLLKAASMLGLGRRAWVPVACEAGTERMDIASLEAALRELDGSPAIVAASAGTVTTTAFDDLARTADRCERHGAFLHVDGAFGLFAAASPRYAGRLEGLGRADSVAVDAHKWLNVPYDTGLVFTRHLALQEKVFQANAAYLTPGSGGFFHRTPENSRRWRALPTWMTLQAYGRQGIRDVVERCCDLASALGDWVHASPDYDLLAPVTLNIVCFAPRTLSADRVLTRLAEDGRCFLTPGEWQGRKGLRAAFSNYMTTEADLALVQAALADAAASEAS